MEYRDSDDLSVGETLHEQIVIPAPIDTFCIISGEVKEKKSFWVERVWAFRINLRWWLKDADNMVGSSWLSPIHGDYTEGEGIRDDDFDVIEFVGTLEECKIKFQQIKIKAKI